MLKFPKYGLCCFAMKQCDISAVRIMLWLYIRMLHCNVYYSLCVWHISIMHSALKAGTFPFLNPRFSYLRHVRVCSARVWIDFVLPSLLPDQEIQKCFSEMWYLAAQYWGYCRMLWRRIQHHLLYRGDWHNNRLGTIFPKEDLWHVQKSRSTSIRRSSFFS